MASTSSKNPTANRPSRVFWVSLGATLATVANLIYVTNLIATSDSNLGEILLYPWVALIAVFVAFQIVANAFLLTAHGRFATFTWLFVQYFFAIIIWFYVIGSGV